MNNLISFKRIGLLYKHFYFLNGKKTLLILIATAGLISGYHAIVHIVNYRFLADNNFLTDYHYSSLSIAFFVACLLWCGNAFPDFRNKIKRIGYLVKPATTLEKFLFEVMMRIVFFIIVFPILYWVFTNMVTNIFHAFIPDYLDYKFSYKNPYPGDLDNLQISLLLCVALLIPTIAFTGATYFKKIPTVKTIVAVTALFVLFFGYTYLVATGLNLDEYLPKNNRILFISSVKQAKITGIFVALSVNLILLVISYFRVKEQEA